MIDEIKTEYEKNIQYILDEKGQLAEILKENCKEVEYPINYKVQKGHKLQRVKN